MSLLQIKKVLKQGDHSWGVVLVDDGGNELLRSIKGVDKYDAESIAVMLKSEGAEAPVSETGKEQAGKPMWVIEKTANGWSVSLTSVAVTSFDLLLKPEAAAEPPKVAVEAVESVKECLKDVEIVWEPPEAKPPSGPITIKIDDEPHEAPKNPMTANEILELGGLNPDENYLVQIKEGERIKYKDKGGEPIELFEGATFVGHFTGEKGVSQSEG